MGFPIFGDLEFIMRTNIHPGGIGNYSCEIIMPDLDGRKRNWPYRPYSRRDNAGYIYHFKTNHLYKVLIESLKKFYDNRRDIVIYADDYGAQYKLIRTRIRKKTRERVFEVTLFISTYNEWQRVKEECWPRLVLVKDKWY